MPGANSSRQAAIQDALNALNSRDWTTGAVIEHGPARDATVTFDGVQFDPDTAHWIAKKAHERGVTPADVIRDLVQDAAALDLEVNVADKPVQVRPSELRQAVREALEEVLAKRAA